MAFEGLADKLSAAFKRLKSKGKLSESDIKEAMREVRLALLEADVNYKVAKEFTAKVSERAVGAEVMESLTPAQMVVKIVNEELTALMGGGESRLASPPSPPTVVMLCGLQGAGKTTHCAKLAAMLKSKGHRPMLVAADIYRPAAIKQLQVLGSKAGVPVFEMGTEKPVEICRAAIRRAKDYGNDFVLIDTAGRLQIDEALMKELREIKDQIGPHEILLTVDAMTGQEAVNVAKTFDEKLNITGVILTKLDGDTRGGACLSIKAVTGKPIKFIGVGEKLGDLEPFYPERMASRILGMGDVLSLIEKAQQAITEEDAKKMQQKMKENSFTLNDYLEQFAMLKKMGGAQSLMSMLPGMGKLKVSDQDVDEKKIERTKAMILSMTPSERENPSIIDSRRKRRIAAGSGTTVQEINQLLKQFEQTKLLMKQLKGNKGRLRLPF